MRVSFFLTRNPYMKFQNPSFKFFLNGRTDKQTDGRTSRKQYASHFFKVGGIINYSLSQNILPICHSGSNIIKHFPRSIQLSMKSKLLINIKIARINGIYQKPFILSTQKCENVKLYSTFMRINFMLRAAQLS